MSTFCALLLFQSSKIFRLLIPLIPRVVRRRLLKFPSIANTVRVLLSGKWAENGSFWTRIPFDNWSGIRFNLGGMTTGHRRFELRVLALRSLFLEVGRVINVPADSLAAVSDGYFYWEPIADSLNSIFMFQIHFPEALDAGTEPESWWLGEILELFGDPERTVPPTPKAILFSPATTCNLNCIHCISRASRRRVQIMPEVIFEQIEKAVRSGYVHHISSDYSGDLLFSDRRHGGWLDRVISLDIAFRVDTHANDLTTANTEKIISSKLEEINFSLDSMDPTVYAAIRRGSKPLSSVLDGIKYFMDQNNRSEQPKRTLISFSMMQRNIDSLLPAIDFAEANKIDVVQFYHVMVFTADIAKESLYLTPDRYADFHRRAVRIASEKNVHLVLPPPVTSPGQRSVHAPCNAPWESLTILGDGTVMACCVPGSEVGNLAEETLDEVWHGPNLQSFRETIHTDCPPVVCHTCPMHRTNNNFRAIAPGLRPSDQNDFVERCVEAHTKYLRPNDGI